MADEGETSGRSMEEIMNESCEGDQESSDGSVEDIYEVEKIVGVSKVKGQVLYKVRWVSYGPEHDTWEPKSNLASCTDLIEQYERECGRSADRVSSSSSHHRDRDDPKRHDSSSVSSQDAMQTAAERKAKAQRKKRAAFYKYVGSSDEEADTLKDKFWRDLEQGKIDVFSRGDLYSKVKGSGRSSRPQSFKEMFSDRINNQQCVESGLSTSKRSSEDRHYSARSGGRVTLSDTDNGQGTSGSHVVKRRARKRSTVRGKMRKKHKHRKLNDDDVSSPGNAETERQSLSEEILTPVSSIPSPTASTTDTSNFHLGFSPTPTTPCNPPDNSPRPARSSPQPSNLSIGHVSDISDFDCKNDEGGEEPKEEEEESCGPKEVWPVTMQMYQSQPPEKMETLSMHPVTSKVEVDEPAMPVLSDVLNPTSTPPARAQHRPNAFSFVSQLAGQTIQSSPHVADKVSPSSKPPMTKLLQTDSPGEVKVLDAVPMGAQGPNGPPDVDSKSGETGHANISSCDVKSLPCDELITINVTSINSTSLCSSVCAPAANCSSASGGLTPAVNPNVSPIIPTPAMKKGGPQLAQPTTLPPVPLQQRVSNAYENPQSQDSATSVDNPHHAYTDPYNQDLLLQTPPSISASSSSSVPSPTEKGSSTCQLQELLLHGVPNSSFVMNTPTTSGGSLTPCSAISGPDYSPQDHNDFLLGQGQGHMQVSNNNQVEKEQVPSCGDLEAMEFDLMDVDPAFWQDKIVERKVAPDYLELSNVELREAVYTNDYTRLSLALKAPCVYDLEQGDVNSTTLIMLACARGYNDIVELLAMSGAQVNATQKNGTTGLMMACELGLEITALLLLQLGAHTAPQTYAGDTALTKAIRRGHREIVQLLLEQGANFSCPHTHPEIAPLVIAKTVNQTEIASLLYKHIDRVSREFERQVQITLNNCATLQGQLFPLQCFPLRESDRFRITFRHELQPTQTGMGMLLFIGHARLSESEVRCRFYGPCAVKSASLNAVKLKPLTEESHFVLSFSPLHNGRNELDIYTAAAPASKAKLLICAYRAAVI